MITQQLLSPDGGKVLLKRQVSFVKKGEPQETEEVDIQERQMWLGFVLYKKRSHLFGKSVEKFKYLCYNYLDLLSLVSALTRDSLFLIKFTIEE